MSFAEGCFFTTKRTKQHEEKKHRKSFVFLRVLRGLIFLIFNEQPLVRCGTPNAATSALN